MAALTSSHSMIDDSRDRRITGSADHVRSLARRGALAQATAAAPEPERSRLRSGAYEIVWPIVFAGLTRTVERGRGHYGCAIGVDHLEPDCLDRYQDDVEAVVDDLLRNAKAPIVNLEGWIRSRLTRATVDGHRRRRGQRGAVQRPRIPRWLAQELGDDPWLIGLAIEVLTWVGIPATAGADPWPYGAWADRRAAVTGDPVGTEQDVAREVDTVLAAMRRHQAWYERFIEDPLGRKQPPLMIAADTRDLGQQLDRTMAGRHADDDARLRELAGAAVDAMAAKFARGEEPRRVVVEIITMLFGRDPAVDQMDMPPGTGDAEEDRVQALLADPDAVDRLVREVCEILGLPVVAGTGG